MSNVQEKLEQLDKELYTLHQFCIQKGFNPRQIEQAAEPIFSIIKEDKKKRCLWNLVMLAFVVATFAACVQYDPVNRLLQASGRLSMLRILPYWDWTVLHDNECLVDNPYFVGRQLREEECELCESLTEIPRVENISHDLVTENYLKQDRPFIVTDAMMDWTARNKFSIHFLSEFYHMEDGIGNSVVCMFLSNVRVPLNKIKLLLHKAADGTIQNYFAHWENCDRQAARSLRQFYKRPYFIPPMVEMAELNWLFIAHTYLGKKSKPADIGLPMMWVAVLKGEMRVILQPREPCNEKCQKLYATIHQGEILVVTDLMWLFDYIPDNNGEMLALGSGGYFD